MTRLAVRAMIQGTEGESNRRLISSERTVCVRLAQAAAGDHCHTHLCRGSWLCRAYALKSDFQRDEESQD